MSQRILYTKPSITELEIAYATDAAANGWGEHCYDYIHRFENSFAKYLGAQYAIATSSCTGAMHLGLAALQIGKGDEVILADSNWVATVAPVVHLGATPVFVDILPDTWCIDPVKVEAAINERTRAIIATHLYGNLCEMDKLQGIANRYNLILIEDAAEAIGSVYRGRKAGSMGQFGVFSFHGTKTLTTGEGGMFVTSDPYLYEQVLTLSNHGRKRGELRQFWPEVIGYKFKISNVQAAIGCAQLERIDDLIARKIEIFNIYKELFGRSEDIKMNPQQEGCQSSYWMPTVVFSSESEIDTGRLVVGLNQDLIDARVFFSPLSSTPSFERRSENIYAYDIPTRSINLPSYHDMTTNEQERVVESIIKVVNN